MLMGENKRIPLNDYQLHNFKVNNSTYSIRILQSNNDTNSYSQFEIDNNDNIDK
jgi:hypothetical protein